MLQRGLQHTKSGIIHRLHPLLFSPTRYGPHRLGQLPLRARSICLPAIAGNGPGPWGTRPSPLLRKTVIVPRYSTTITNPPPNTVPNGQPNTSDNNTPPPPPPPPPRGRIRPILTTLFFLTAGAYILFLPSWQKTADKNLPLHPTKFQPWVIVAREPCGDTASGASAKSAIFVLRPKPIEGATRKIKSTGGEGLEWDEFWKKGVWSVEVKQPELMVSRRYTPLPDLSRVLPSSYTSTTWSGALNTTGEGGVDVQGEDGGELAGELKFYIKEENGGEVSRWLFGLPVGTEVWLRGPRYEWEYPWYQDGTQEKDTAGDEGIMATFLAGGTGIAPALQTAASFFEPENVRGLIQQESASTTKTTPPSSKSKGDVGNATISTPGSIKPKINYNILWAVRTPEDLALPLVHELALLSNLATHTGIGFSVAPHIDSLNTYITQEDIENAISSPSRKIPNTSPNTKSWTGWLGSFLPGGGDSQKKVPEQLESIVPMDRDVRDRYILVSGPEGFITHFAGEKGPGGNTQGKVSGVVREVVRRGRESEKVILDGVGPGKDQEGGEWVEVEKEKEKEKEKEVETGKRVRWFVWKL